MTPSVQVRPRAPAVHSAALDSGFTALQADLLAARLDDAQAGELQSFVSPRLRELYPPDRLPDIQAAAQRLGEAIVRGETVIINVDFDADGSTAGSVIYLALTTIFGHPPEQARIVIGLRLRDGYGMSDNVADRILGMIDGPTVCITADQGSTSHEQITRLKDAGVDTIVTDHHGIPQSGPPGDATACVNPSRTDSQFGDPCIAGVHVAWLVMCATRRWLIDAGHLPPQTQSLAHLLDLVALGTYVDCTSMGRSINNRAVVRHGLLLMNRPGYRPCWDAVRALFPERSPFNHETLGFFLGPLQNASGRLDDAMMGVRFLLSEDVEDAKWRLAELAQANESRKQIEATMRGTAMQLARSGVAAGRQGLTIFLPEGHPGIHGITCSRVVSAVGRPAGCFSPKVGQPDQVTGSFRSIPGISVRECLQEVGQTHPELGLVSGGHDSAAGAHLPMSALLEFTDAFDRAVRARCTSDDLGPRIYVDTQLEQSPGLHLIPEIQALEPYGREFPSPVFQMRCQVQEIKAVGDGTHLKLTVVDLHGQRHPGIWFGAMQAGDPPPVAAGQECTLAYELDQNTWRGRTTHQLRVVAATQDP